MEFLAFARIVRGMAQGEHLSSGGFSDLLEIALAMNGGGRYRREYALDGIKNPQRPYAKRQTENLAKIWSDLHGDM
jgi:hypothetical protein